MRKTAGYRVSRLSRFCNDPEEVGADEEDGEDDKAGETVGEFSEDR